MYVLQNDSGDLNKRESEILKIYEQVTKDQQIFSQTMKNEYRKTKADKIQ